MFQTNLYMSNYLHIYWRLRSLLFIYYQFIFIDIYSSFVESVFLYLFHCVLPASNWLVQSHERDDEEVNTRKKSLLEKLRYLADRIHPPQIQPISFTDTCSAVLWIISSFFQLRDIVFLRWRKPTVNYTSSSFNWDHFVWDRQLSCTNLPRLRTNKKVPMVVGKIPLRWNRMVLMFFTSEKPLCRSICGNSWASTGKAWTIST